MKKYPESVLTKDKKGKIEVRNLISRGQFVTYDYREPKSFKTVGKKKICLKDEEGKITEYFIIPLKTPNKSLLISDELENKERKVWNDKTKKEDELWKT